jgi:outer membrane protein, multidrug efflux system
VSRLVQAALLSLLAVGCAVGPDYVPPTLETRAAYLEGGEGAASRPEDGAASRAAPWWTTFGDPTLAAFVDDAARGAYDLRVAAARVEEAFAARGVARTAALPNVDATASAARRRESGSGLFFSEPISYDNLRAGLETSWEIDLFGRVRRQIEAAEADAGAAEEALLDATRVVVAEVVAEYAALRGAERELRTTLRNAEVQSGVLNLVERLAEAGVGAEVDAARARSLLNETLALTPNLRARIAEGAHRLSILTGLDAAVVKARLNEGGTPTPPATPEAGVPSDLLRARPDVRVAERELAAATARIGVATADLYPRVTLTGLFGVESVEAESLFESKAVSFGVGPSIRWPLLDYGATRDRVAAAGARQKAALARYEHVVARAIAEVETALAFVAARRATLERLALALAHANEAARLVEERFSVGASSFLDVLDSRRRVLAIETDKVRAETALNLDLVALNRALARSA